MKTMYWNAHAKFFGLKNRVAEKIGQFEEACDEKKEGMSQSVEIIIIVIAVIAVGVIMKAAMPTMFNELLQKAKTTISAMF